MRILSILITIQLIEMPRTKTIKNVQFILYSTLIVITNALR